MPHPVLVDALKILQETRDSLNATPDIAPADIARLQENIQRSIAHVDKLTREIARQDQPGSEGRLKEFVDTLRDLQNMRTNLTERAFPKVPTHTPVQTRQQPAAPRVMQKQTAYTKTTSSAPMTQQRYNSLIRQEISASSRGQEIALLMRRCRELKDQAKVVNRLQNVDASTLASLKDAANHLKQDIDKMKKKNESPMINKLLETLKTQVTMLSQPKKPGIKEFFQPKRR